MSHKLIHRNKLVGGVLLGTIASGFAAAAIGSVGTASATCASISGIGNGNGCTSTPTSFAVGIGNGTQADAAGLFTGAIATGTNTTAQSTGSFSLAVAGGSGSVARTVGNLNLAVAGLGFQGTPGAGKNLFAQAGTTSGDIGNVAVNLGSSDNLGQSQVVATGVGNVAANIGGNANNGKALTVLAAGLGNAAFNVSGNRNIVTAVGTGNLAANIGNDFTFPNGSDNVVEAGTPGNPATLSAAFNINGVNNVVKAGPGPGAVAGAIFVNDHNGVGTNPPAITQSGFGVNIKSPLNP